MKQVEEYKARAEMAEAQARRARDERERAAFLEIASLWRRLAQERLSVLRGE